jgi:hypothetical protein
MNGELAFLLCSLSDQQEYHFHPNSEYGGKDLNPALLVYRNWLT